MNPLLFIAAALAGGIGAALRHLVDIGLTRLLGTRFPWGIVLVNVSGSFALGLVVTALPDASFIVGAGLLGGYTTFSTAMLDALGLWRDGERSAAVAHGLGTLAASVVAALGGLVIGALLH